MKVMNAEIICVGTEILLGNIVDTNSSYISNKLSVLGINLFYHTSVGDNELRLISTVKNAAKRSDLIILTGGLGPTYDDITKEATAKAFGRGLYLDDNSLDEIKAYFSAIGREMTENNVKQAYIIDGAHILHNDKGTAPGMVFDAECDGKSVTVAILPGPPHEMSHMFDKYLYPYLEGVTGQSFYSSVIKIYGVGESKIENDLKDIMESSKDPTLAPYAKSGEVELRLTSAAKTREEAEKKFAPIISKIKDMYGTNVYGVDIPNLETALYNKLKERGLSVSFAESCTGGLLAKRLTDVAGASEVMGFSAVTYSATAKERILNVSKDVIDKYGVISNECAAEMAKGIVSLSNADIGVSVTGVAGPNTSEEKPVGLVCVGIYAKGREPLCIELNFAKGRIRSRENIRELAASYAIYRTICAIDEWCL